MEGRRRETWGKVGKAADVSIRKFQAFIFFVRVAQFYFLLPHSDLNKSIVNRLNTLTAHA